MIRHSPSFSHRPSTAPCENAPRLRTFARDVYSGESPVTLISNELIHPAREKNALLEVATAFLFKTSPSAMKVQQFRDALLPKLQTIGFSDILDSSLNAIQIELTLDGPGTGEILSSEYGGFQIFKKQDSQPEWLVKFNRNKDAPGSFLVVSCFLYDSWSEYVTFLQRILDVVPITLDGDEIDRIGFVCTDGFSIGPCEDPIKAISEAVLNASSSYIPTYVLDTVGEWSFAANSIEASLIERVDRVQSNISASVTRTQNDTAVFKLTHVQEFQLSRPHMLSGSRRDMCELLNEAHRMNKTVLENVLRPGLSHQIGLIP